MFKAIDKWLPGYLGSVLRRPRSSARPRDLFFCVADHFEPLCGGVDVTEARADVAAWSIAYPESVRGFRDADGRAARHTFFYPQEEYDPAILDRLSGLCRDGFGEVEIHLHHRHDTADGLREKLETFRDVLHMQHGLLGRERPKQKDAKSAKGMKGCAPGAVRYGFIHGNWALGNSRPDGDWCGVNEELGILAATGCYADFTFPSAPSPTQTRMVNAIYRATDRPGRPRGADRGVRVKVGGERWEAGGERCEVGGGRQTKTADGRPQTTDLKQERPPTCHLPPITFPASLMLIQGPLALNWTWRKWGILPRLENAEITGVNPPTADRLRLWAEACIGVGGQPDWVFVKVHTHGCVAANRAVILGPAMRGLHEALQGGFNDGAVWRLHYVSAREMYNLARAAEDGRSGDPASWRDYEVGPPPVVG